ncbi:MAG: VOC family protein [Pseudomonadota bacterium]
MSIELDHIFWMVAKADADRVTARFETLGLRESYRRDHPGQGTTNICYCFDNAFLEILWLENEADARSPAIARTLLADRGTGKANPFGLAWRGDAQLPMWAFMPTYLPDGVSIQMASASDDPSLPLMFTFSGFKPPIALPPDRHNGMQHAAGFTRLDLTAIGATETAPLECMAAMMVPGFNIKAGKPFVQLKLSGPQREPIMLDLPF